MRPKLSALSARSSMASLSGIATLYGGRVAGPSRGKARGRAQRRGARRCHNRRMLDGFFGEVLRWVGEHPLAAGIAIFLIAFADAVVVLGAAVPALPLLFGIGVLVGLGEISGPYAVASAALGALAGDGISYWVGRRLGPGLRGIWPFTRYPQLLARGETLFRRNAVKSILVARYVGPVRPFVPAIAGIARM